MGSNKDHERDFTVLRQNPLSGLGIILAFFERLHRDLASTPDEGVTLFYYDAFRLARPLLVLKSVTFNFIDQRRSPNGQRR